MNELDFKKMLEDSKLLQFQIDFYLKNKVISAQTPLKSEIQGHIEKAEHNLNFVKDSSGKYSDWGIVGCYYAAYHIALALILSKGYSSKNHDATLCLLIKHYYKKELSKEDLELLNSVYLDNQDILFYVESKIEREKASYSSQIAFDKKRVSDLQLKTILFVNRCKEIMKNQ